MPRTQDFQHGFSHLGVAGLQPTSCARGIHGYVGSLIYLRTTGLLPECGELPATSAHWADVFARNGFLNTKTSSLVVRHDHLLLIVRGLNTILSTRRFGVEGGGRCNVYRSLNLHHSVLWLENVRSVDWMGLHGISPYFGKCNR
jgi:hypothetical protein